MTLSETQRLIDESDYWDMSVKEMECNHFADEVRIIYDDSEGGSVCYKFSGCYKTIFDHVKEYSKDKPIRDMLQTQLPYFMQDVKISEITEEDNHLWVCEINMFPLYLEIWCRNIKIEKRSHNVLHSHQK